MTSAKCNKPSKTKDKNANNSPNNSNKNNKKYNNSSKTSPKPLETYLFYYQSKKVN